MSIAIVCALGMIINHVVFNPPKKLYAGVALFGKAVDMLLLEELEKELDLLIPPEMQNSFKTEVNNFYTSDNPQINMAMVQKFNAVIMANELDIIITDQANYDDILSQDGLMPLESILESFGSAKALQQNGSTYGLIIGEDSPLAKYNTDLSIICCMGNSEKAEAVKPLFLYFLGP